MTSMMNGRVDESRSKKLAGGRWWTVQCQNLACRWSNTRKTRTKAQAEKWGCPKCNSPVTATPSTSLLQTRREPGDF